MDRKKLIIISVIVFALVVLGFFFCKRKSVNDYETAEAFNKTIVQTVEATGTVNPVQIVTIGSLVSGMLQEIYVDYNSHIKKGQLLATIDPALIQAQVEQARATLNSKKANYEKAKSVLEYNLVTYQRYQTLYKKNYISKNELDNAKSNYLSQKATVAAAAAEIQQANATLQNNLTNLGYTKIYSPVDGVVISKEVEIGQSVAASFQTPTLFKVAKDLSDMQIETSVSEADIGKVKVGQDVNYTLDGYADRIFKGKVSQVRLASTTTNNVVTYTVVIDVDNEEGVLLPGMTANVEIITSKKDNVLVVPNMALKFAPVISKEKHEKQGVWVLEKGKLKRIDVEVGVSDDAHTEVVSDQLKQGSRVVLASKNKDKGVSKRTPHPPM